MNGGGMELLAGRAVISKDELVAMGLPLGMELLAGRSVITKDKFIAEDWVMNLPLGDPSQPIPRIFGFSCSWGVDDDGTPVLHSIHLSFFSGVLVLHVAGWGLGGGVLPQVLADLLSNDRNLFVGDEVKTAAAKLERSYGVMMAWTMDIRGVMAPKMDLDVVEGMRHVGEAPPHVVLAGSMLNLPETWLVMGGGEGPWTWPLSNLQVRFALESCVVARLLGEKTLRPSAPLPGVLALLLQEKTRYLTTQLRSIRERAVLGVLRRGPAAWAEEDSAPHHPSTTHRRVLFPDVYDFPVF